MMLKKKIKIGILYIIRAYSRPLLGVTITPNLVPYTLKQIFSLEAVKNVNCLEGASKQNAIFSKNVPQKNAPMPQMSKIGPDRILILI